MKASYYQWNISYMLMGICMILLMGRSSTQCFGQASIKQHYMRAHTLIQSESVSQQSLNTAEREVKTAIQMAHVSDNQDQLLMALQVCGNVYDKKGASQDSVRYWYRQWRDISKQVGNEISWSFALLKIGHSYFKEGNYRQARIEYEYALPERLKLKPMKKEYHNTVVGTLSDDLNYIGMTYSRLHRYLEARELYLKPAIIYADSVAGSKSRKEKARANAFNSLGDNYYYSQEYDSALSYYHKALALYTKHKKEEYIAKTLSDLSMIFYQQDSLNVALAYQNLAFEIRFRRNRKQPSRQRDLELSNSYYNRGVYLMAQKEYGEAEKDLRKALEIRGKYTNQATAQANVMQALGHLFLEASPTIEARIEAQKWFQQAKDSLLMPGTAPFDLRLPPRRYIRDEYVLLATLSGLGRTQYRLYLEDNQGKNQINLLDSSLYYLRHAAALLDSLRHEQPPARKDVRMHLSKISVEPYEYLLLALHHLYERNRDTSYLQEAYQIIERSKHLTLLESIHAAQTMSPLPAILDSIQQVDELKKELKANLQRANTEAEKKAYASAYRAAYKQKAMWRDSLWRSDPHLYHANYGRLVTSLRTVQRHCIDSTSLLLSYFIGKEDGFLLIMGQDIVDFRRLGSPSSTGPGLDDAKHPRALVKALQRTWEVEKEYANFPRIAHELYTILLGPGLEELMQGKKRLIILPGDGLYGLPFDVLVPESVPVGKTQFNRLPYLIHKYAISYELSASLFYSLRRADLPTWEETSMLGLAPEFSDKPSSRYAPIHKGLELVRQSISAYQGKGFYGSEALEATFKELAHAYESCIIVSHAEKKGHCWILGEGAQGQADVGKEDGKLFPFEVLQLNLQKMYLAILIGCGTSEGEEVEGEGIFSLATSFQYAGCGNLVSSLWKLPEENIGMTQLMMTYMENGFPIDEALRQAKIDYFLSDSDPQMHNPKLWAGLVFVGDYRPIPAPNTVPWTKLFMLLLLGVLFLFYQKNAKFSIKR